MERGPDLGARAPNEEPDRLAGVAQRQDEEPGAPVRAGVRIADHRALAVIDLAFFTRGRGDDDTGLDGGLGPQRGDVAADTGVAPGKPVVVDQVLPDGHGVAPAAQRLDNQLAIRLARARPRRPARRRERSGVGGHRCRGGRFWPARVGGHLGRGGRFWWPGPRPAPTPAHRGPRRPSDSRSPSLGGRPLPPRCVAATSRVAPAPELAVVCVRSRRCSSGVGTVVPRRRQRLNTLRVVAGFQVSIDGRFWVSTEASERQRFRGSSGRPSQATSLVATCDRRV